MLTKKAIYKKCANLLDYTAFVEKTISELKNNFPAVSLKSFSEFRFFLDSLVPKLVHKYILLAGTMKNCSGVSPDFAELAAQSGFPVLVQSLPGHQRNVVLTTDGPYAVDLTYIQFVCKYDLSDKSARKEVLENYKSLRKDPFKAIKIEKLNKEPISGVYLPNGEYWEGRPDPLKSIEEYNIEEYEEAYPERFDRFK